MPDSEKASDDRGVVRFGLFEADLRAGELRKNGLKIKLQEQPFQILAMLLAQPGEIITREELQTKLWPADTFVDFDHSLNTAVKKLRQALGDDADNPRFIETIPRRGYRFLETTAVSIETVPALPTQEKRKANPWWWMMGVLALTIVGAVWFVVFRPATQATLPTIRIVPLNGVPRQAAPAFSPDGTRVAYMWPSEKNDGVSIYVTQIGAETPLRVTTHEKVGDVAPAWSPDGNYIAFSRFSAKKEEEGIYVISALGGSERKVYSYQGQVPKTLDWSPDGSLLALSDRRSDSEPYALFLLSLDTFEARRLTTPPAETLGDSDAKFSPDGKTLAFTRDLLDTQEINVVPLAGGTPRQVTFDKRLILGLAWSSDSREIIYSTNRQGSFSLWRIPAAGGTSERLPVGGGFWAVQPSVSRKANRLAYREMQYNSNIWRIELASAGVAARPAEKFIGSTQLEEGPQFSADGKKIAFQSTRTGSYEIWRCDQDGSNPIQLTHFDGPLTGTPRWSPDGKRIAFDSRPEGHTRIFTVSAEGGGPQRVTSGPGEDAVPGWSTDGKWILFASNRSGSWQIWKTPADGGPPVQVTRQGGFAPRASPDGKFVYYSKGRDLPGIWRIAVEGGDETKVLDSPPGSYWGYWAAVEQGIYFADDLKAGSGIYFYDFATRVTTKVAPFEKHPSEGAPGLAVSPDHRTILFVQLEPVTGYIMLVENFR